MPTAKTSDDQPCSALEKRGAAEGVDSGKAISSRYFMAFSPAAGGLTSFSL